MVRKVLAGFAVALVATGALAGLAPGAQAAGVTTHTWMAVEAIPRVTNPDLRALLQANLRQVEAGAHFPDSGYGSSALGIANTYGEEAHWPRFSYAYLDQIRDDPRCGDLTDPTGPCAARIAHALGAVAHGIGDEVWDWLFEPAAPDHGESYAPPGTPATTGGMELQMDMVAIQDYRRPTMPDLPEWPNQGRLVGVFASIGRTDVTGSNLDDGERLMRIARAGERLITSRHHWKVTENQPWLSSHLVTAPGGVRFAARAIAANWDTLWGRLLDDQPATEVAVTYPAAGEDDIPHTGWTRASFSPGSSPDRGGAANRITAVLSSSLAYRPSIDSPLTIASQLPAGAMTLTDVATGDPVPLRSGYPRIVPYTPEAGEHTIDLQPDGDLAPCAEYRVDVTEALLDANAQPVTPFSWTFRTDGCTETVHRPDAQVRVVDEFRADDLGAWIGADVQNAGGVGQQRATTRPRGQSITFDLDIVNDGTVPDTFAVLGQGAAPGFKVQYFTDAGANVTGAVKSGTYQTGELAPGAAARLQLRVTVKNTALVGTTVTRVVRATSTADGTAVDAVKATVTRGPLPSLGPVPNAATVAAEFTAAGPALLCLLG